MNIPSVILHENSWAGVELFHADRRTYGRTEARKLIVAFRSCFANAPKGQLVSKESASVCYRSYNSARSSTWCAQATIPHGPVRGVLLSTVSRSYNSARSSTWCAKPSRLLTRLFVVLYLIRIGERDCHGAGNFEHRRL